MKVHGNPSALCILDTVIRHYQGGLAPVRISPLSAAFSNGLPSESDCISNFGSRANIDLGYAL